MSSVPPPALLHGPYCSPRVSIGDWISCEIRGLVQVKTFTDAPIPQPIKRGQGAAIIVCGDLARALPVESNAAVAFWWGVSTHQVSRWRVALGVDPATDGTLALWASNPGNPDIGQLAVIGNQASLVPEIRSKRDKAHAATMAGRTVDPKIGRKGGRAGMAARTPEQKREFAAIGGKAAASRDEFEKRASAAKRFRTLGNSFRYERMRDRLIMDMRIAGKMPSVIAATLGLQDAEIYTLLYDLAARYPSLASDIITSRQMRRNELNRSRESK